MVSFRPTFQWDLESDLFLQVAFADYGGRQGYSIMISNRPIRKLMVSSGAFSGAPQQFLERKDQVRWFMMRISC